MLSHVSGAVAPLPALNQRYSLSVMLMLLAALLLGFGMLNAGVKQSGYVGTSDARVALIQPSSLLATDEQQSLTPLDSGDEPQWLLALLSGLVLLLVARQIIPTPVSSPAAKAWTAVSLPPLRAPPVR
ncbi:hypothetical protein CFI10_03765 [Marinobacterium iners]|uniref:hypothetical protein n=1 Tax=Marinobacterium iners TaxID=48076 RepID=UPI001A8E3552|nr:hypothetical protein [Marinobacterium iners]QSR34111.1 hypothetical protein CFI10_03765 [Marinobacterium iners]